MERIYKYTLTPTGGQKIEMPTSSIVLSVENQNDNIVMYALINPTEPSKEYEFFVVGTGWPLPETVLANQFVGTVVTAEGSLVWHVFSLVAPLARHILG